MLLSQIPAKFQKAFAANASAGNIRAVPLTTSNPNAASLTLGWPPATMAASGAGGVPPDGRDMNGIDNQLSAWALWLSVGGVIQYDATQQAAVGGYPQYAVIGSLTNPGTYWQSTVDNNTTNPDSSGAGWVAWPSSASIPWGSPPPIGNVSRNEGFFSLLEANVEIFCTGPIDGSDLQIDGVGFTQVFGQNGYQKLPSGLIMQWGRLALPTGNGDHVVFPIAFPTDMTFATDTGYGGGQPTILQTDFIDVSPPYTGFTARAVQWNGSTWNTTATSIGWVAFGY